MRGMSDVPKKILDFEQALDRVGGRKALLVKIINTFVHEIPGQIAHLQQALRANDMEEAERKAHGMNGSASLIGADRFRGKALQIELCLKSGSVPTSEQLEELDGEFQAFMDEVGRRKLL